MAASHTNGKRGAPFHSISDERGEKRRKREPFFPISSRLQSRALTARIDERTCIPEKNNKIKYKVTLKKIEQVTL